MNGRLLSGTKLRAAVFSAAFFLTGVATAMLGAALPAMLAQWHLSDRGGGLLLFSSFGGATIGALLVGNSPRHAPAVGLGATGMATLLLAAFRHGPFPPIFFVYGLGLGTTMTSISMIRSREAEPGTNAIALNRLNLLWAAGACCAPALAIRSLRLVSVASLFRLEGMAFLLGAASVGVATYAVLGSAHFSSAAPAPPPPMPLAPLRMCLFAAAAVGLESAIGGWLTTYTQREAHGMGIAVWSNSAFWAGLLLSRAAHSLPLGRQLARGWGVVGHLTAVGLAAALLVLPLSTMLLPLAAMMAGIGLGPLYPLVLSLALPHYRSGVVFVFAGIGAALLPWLTGVLSTSFQSLRIGLSVPCAAVLVLLACAQALQVEIQATDQVPA